VLAGIALGTVVAAATTRWLSTLLFHVRPDDPGTFAAVAALLATVTLLACYAAARRAAAIDAAVALRAE